MGTVIEDHTKQLDQIEMKEKNILEREEELKKMKYQLSIEQEKCRLHEFENGERETRLRDKENRMKEKGDLMNLAVDPDAEKQELKSLSKEIEVMNLELQSCSKELDTTKKLLAQSRSHEEAL